MNSITTNSVLSGSVRKANDSGRLALTLYVIPGFPSVSAFKETAHMLEELDFVSVVETTVPVTAGFSPRANDKIRAAHCEASVNTCGIDLKALMTTSKSCFGILYEHSVVPRGMNALLNELDGVLDGVMLEWRGVDTTPMREAAESRAVEWMESIRPDETDEELSQKFKRLRDDAYLYLVSGPKTGGPLTDLSTLARGVDRAKSMKPNATISAGFGVRGASEIEQLATISGLDGVIIGTAYLEQAALGPKEARAYLLGLEQALRRRD